jgi:hypothetical protein
VDRLFELGGNLSVSSVDSLVDYSMLVFTSNASVSADESSESNVSVSSDYNKFIFKSNTTVPSDECVAAANTTAKFCEKIHCWRTSEDKPPNESLLTGETRKTLWFAGFSEGRNECAMQP